MAGIIAPETPDDPSVYAPNGYSRVDRTWMEGFHAQVTESFNTTAIGPQLWREGDRQFGNTSSPMLSREQANEQYGIPDVLQFDQPINAEHAAERQRLVQDQMRRQSIVDRSGLGTVWRLFASVLGGAADPVNIAFAVAPEMLLSRFAGLGRGAALSLSERMAFSASSGALGNAVLTPAQAYFAGQEGREYGIGEALADITLGAAIGGAAPIVGRGLSALRTRWMRDATRVADAIHSVGEPSTNPTRLANATPEQTLETLSTVLQHKLLGMPANLSAVVEQLDSTARLLNTVDNDISVASKYAAATLRRQLGDMTPAQLRREGRAPIGEATFTRGDVRSTIEWHSNEYGVVGPRDIERMSPITQTMVPVEEAADSATWRVHRASDGRIVEYKLREMPDGLQKWDVTIAPKKSPLSRFIDDQAPADLRTAFTSADESSLINATSTRAEARLADPDELLNSFAGRTYRAGEQQPAADNFRTIGQEPIVGDPTSLQDLAAMRQLIDEAPPVPRSARDEGQVLGQGTAATRELEQFAAQDEAVLQTLRDQGRLTAADEAQFEQVAELEKQYKELAQARARATECFIMEGNI